MTLSAELQQRLQQLLNAIYGNPSEQLLADIIELLAARRQQRVGPEGELWNERDVVLITYGDQVSGGPDGEAALGAQHRFLNRHGMQDLISTVHLLPFCPYTSDDGFSVSDYLAVNPAVGSWSDIRALAGDYDLMFDLVLNHCSQSHEWFQQFLGDQEPGREYFLALNPDVDLSDVTRPRTSPLLTPFETAAGRRYVWTTFSADQVDLNYASPRLLVEMLSVLLEYAQRGARIIRLDAIAYLWKKLGTSCIHLPQTHAVVKLMRCLLDEVAPGCIVLTETNVPHAENVSYFGVGDEAQMVYQFSLAPLLLDALMTGDAAPLNSWLRSLEPCRPGTTFLNFTASHDGIGVRPLEGLVTPQRRDALISAVRELGGQVSCKQNSDGTESPYELNITYFSALGGQQFTEAEHTRRFLSSQAVMLALQGIPAVYFHSLVGTPNDVAGVKQTGRARSVNRRKFEFDELNGIVEGHEGAQAQVFAEYRKMLRTRRTQPAFHPDAGQTVLPSSDGRLILFAREPFRGGRRLIVGCNVSGDVIQLDVSKACERSQVHDLLSDHEFSSDSIELLPWQAVWLVDGDA